MAFGARAAILGQRCGLSRHLQGGDRSSSRRGALSRLHRYLAHQGQLPQRALLRRAQWPQADHRVVLERLSRHGPASRRRRGDGGSAPRRRRRIGRHAQHRRQHPLSRRSRGRACRPSRQAGRAAVHQRLRLERGGAVDARQAASRLRDLLGRAQPRLDDRRHSHVGLREARVPPQRPRASRAIAARRRPRNAQADRVRKRLFDGRRRRPDRRDLRPRRPLWRADLSRRSPRRRHVRRARRRHFGARRRSPTA